MSSSSSTTTSSLLFVDHFAAASAEQGRSLCSGRCRPVKKSFASSGRKRKRVQATDTPPTALDLEASRDAIALEALYGRFRAGDETSCCSVTTNGRRLAPSSYSAFLHRCGRFGCSTTDDEDDDGDEKEEVVVGTAIAAPLAAVPTKSCQNCDCSMDDDVSRLREWRTLAELAQQPHDTTAPRPPLLLLSDDNNGGGDASTVGGTSGDDGLKSADAAVTVRDEEVLRRLVRNLSATRSAAVTLSSGGLSFLAPPRSSFVLGDCIHGDEEEEDDEDATGSKDGAGCSSSSSSSSGKDGGLLATSRPPTAFVPLLRDRRRRFSVIVLDPPWPSKSVARSGAYSVIVPGKHRQKQQQQQQQQQEGGQRRRRQRRRGTEGGESLTMAGGKAWSVSRELLRCAAAAGALANRRRGALVGCWVTNDRKVADAVTNDLFPAMGAIPLASAKSAGPSPTKGVVFWLKVACDGAPVTPLLFPCDSTVSTSSSSSSNGSSQHHATKAAAAVAADLGADADQQVDSNGGRNGSKRSSGGSGGGGAGPRRPFEKLLLGWVPPANQPSPQRKSAPAESSLSSSSESSSSSSPSPSPSPSPSSSSSSSSSTSSSGARSDPMRVVVSVPLRHSWKPPLTPLLDDCLASLRRRQTQSHGDTATSVPATTTTAISHHNDAGDCDEQAVDFDDEGRLEVFARELRPGWTCIGNEVLLFQQPTFFRSVAR